MSWILDTTFLIDLARGDEGARAWLEGAQTKGGAFLVPSVVAAEYLAGSQQPVDDLEAMAAAGDIVGFGVPEAMAAGALARRAFAQGRFPGWADLFVAATAQARGLPLVTRNERHFEDVETVAY